METRPKILLIDDEEIVLDSCIHILEGSGSQIATATTGERGLALLREFQPDLVVVDLKMPGMSGFEILEAVHARDPSIVTVVITGYATVSSAVDAMKKGAYDFLPKPFTPDEFRLIVRRSLEKRKLVLETIALRREREILRENFAAIVSHELKSPLGSIQQNLYTLVDELSGKITAEQQHRLERMKIRIDDLLKLIHTWLRVLSVDVDKLKENFRLVSMQPVIEKAIDSVQPQAIRKNIEIVGSFGGPSPVVHGDEVTLVEVFVNIIGNAVKYSRAESQVAVKIETKDDNVLVSVSDTGVGIAEEDLPHIFDGFYRAESGKEFERGCGLGLAISARIIEAHKGKITVQSALGKGSTFVISVPALKTDSRVQPSREGGVVAHAPKGGIA